MKMNPIFKYNKKKILSVYIELNPVSAASQSEIIKGVQ